jgi:hypothetical protein
MEFAAVLKFTPILLERPEELRINKMIKVNVKLFVYFSLYVPNAHLNVECLLLIYIQ